MRSCVLLTLNYIKMTSIELLKEIESWLSFNTEPSKEETAKLRKSIKEHLTEQLRIGTVSNSEVFKHYGKPFTSGRDLWNFLTAHYNFTPKT